MAYVLAGLAIAVGTGTLAVSGDNHLATIETFQATLPLSIQVDALRGWQSTGLSVTAGTPLRLAVTAGTWTYWVNNSPMQPGTGDDYICANIMPASQCTEPMPGERKGALIGRIGQRMFLIGQQRDLVVEDTGTIELRINDPDSALHDNGGVLTLEIGPPVVGGTGEPISEPTSTPPPAPMEPTTEPAEPTHAPATDAPPPAPSSTSLPEATPTSSTGIPVTVTALPLALPRTGGGGSAHSGR